jgi:bifunctional non-homologous end joining protein LigD
VKVKVRLHQELVIGGWLPGERGRAGRIGAVVVGYHDAPGLGPLRYAGRVGTGFTDAELDRLASRFLPITTTVCPFDPPPSRAEAPAPTWLQPSLVCEVAFTEWTGDGRLRHPVYLGLRQDKAPADVVRE